MANRAEQIREEIDTLLCEYCEEYGQDPDNYDFENIDGAINEISGGLNPLSRDRDETKTLETINELKKKYKKFAYDNCHKFYIIEDDHDEETYKSYGYDIYSIDKLLEEWKDACSLKFISNAKLTKQYIKQA